MHKERKDKYMNYKAQLNKEESNSLNLVVVFFKNHLKSNKMNNITLQMKEMNKNNPHTNNSNNKSSNTKMKYKN
jgi:hypothetical protein